MSEETQGRAQADGDSAKERAQEIYDCTERRSRRIGYVVLFLICFAIFIPMIVGAIDGVRSDQIWDSFTGEELTRDDHDLDCEREAGDLIYLAGEYRDLDARWERRYRRWTERCQEDHQQLYHLLVDTRDRLRGAEELPDIDDIQEDE